LPAREDQKFDRRDVYIITQNALADGTYLSYIRAQYNAARKSILPSPGIARSSKEREQNYATNFIARSVQPSTISSSASVTDRKTRAPLLPGSDKDLPTRFPRHTSSETSRSCLEYLYENLSPETQKLLSGDQEALAAPQPRP